MSRALYNEIEPYAASWLSNLADEGRIAPGRVDTRSVVDLRPTDLDGVEQFHAFAGIGGWSLALRLAGVPDDAPIWTGSCPCQPFSAAGRQRGFADERHLWPAWFDLIRECRPAIVFGEQVEAAVRLGWLDAVFADLEAEGYACGATVLGAHSVGAPHIRQRLWFVAHNFSERRQWGQGFSARRFHDRANAGWAEGSDGPVRLHETGAVVVGDAWREGWGEVGQDSRGSGTGSAAEGLAKRPLHQRARGQWTDLKWLACRDGKSRPTRPGLQPLAHGLSGRVGKLRASGNAIVPQVAAAFVAACLDSLASTPSPQPSEG